MPITNKSKLIDIECLKTFKTNYDSEVDEKIAGAGTSVTKESIETALGYTPANVNNIPTNVSDLINDSGYTTNKGTITGIKMNGASKGTSGVVDLGTVLTEHQDISGKSDVGHKHTKSEITDFPTSMTPTAHNQASSTINAMTGYSKPESTSAITSSDTLNSAIGKLEKALDNKGTSSFSGSYNDLTNKPTIPSVGNGTITIKQAGTTKGTFTTNQSGNTTIELTDNNTTYGVVSTSANGLCPKRDGSTTKYLRGDGTWAVPEGNGGITYLDSEPTSLVVGMTWIGN